MGNTDYLSNYKAGQESFKEGLTNYALDEFKEFLKQKNHATNSLEVSNAHRYISKLYYEKGEYSKSLNTWCLKKTRSCFTWKDFYSRALAAIIEFRDVMDKNYVLVQEKNGNYEYNVIDVLIDLEIAQSLVHKEINNKVNIQDILNGKFYGSRSNTKLRWLFEIYYNSHYYKVIVINILFQLKNANITPVDISSKEKKYKIYNKDVSAKINCEINDYNLFLKSNNNAFEIGMGELIQIQGIKRYIGKLIYRSNNVANNLNHLKYDNDWDFIPDGFFYLEQFKLKINLYKCSNLLNDEEREHQKDLWKSELVKFDFEKTLKSTSNLNLIKNNLIESDWEFDWSSVSFSASFHNYRISRDKGKKLIRFFKSQIMPEKDWASESMDEERKKYLSSQEEDQNYDNQNDDYDPYGDIGLGNPHGWW